MDASQAPEVVPSHDGPQVYDSHDSYNNWNNNDYRGKEERHEPVIVANPEKKILGMRRMTFWLSLALVLVIVAAAVAGGVAGSLKNTHDSKATDSNDGTPTSSSPPSSSSPSSSSPSSTTSGGAFVAPTDVILPLPCDKTRPSVLIGNTYYDFNATCGIDHPKGDLLPIIAYSMQDCLTACAKYNSKWGEGTCAGVVFGADLKKYMGMASGNCYLKNSTSTGGEVDGVMSAVLVGTTDK